MAGRPYVGNFWSSFPHKHLRMLEKEEAFFEEYELHLGDSSLHFEISVKAPLTSAASSPCRYFLEAS